VGSGHAPDQLLTRLAENEGILIGTCNLLTAAVKANRRIAPAGEWLLDNFRGSNGWRNCANQPLGFFGEWAAGFLYSFISARSC
jgi:hypothetical protein